MTRSETATPRPSAVNFLARCCFWFSDDDDGGNKKKFRTRKKCKKQYVPDDEKDALATCWEDNNGGGGGLLKFGIHKKRDKKVRINKAKNQNNYIDGSRTVLELDDDEGGIGYARILKTPTMAPRAIRLTPVEVTEDVLTNRRLSNISQRSVKQREMIATAKPFKPLKPPVAGVGQISSSTLPKPATKSSGGVGNAASAIARKFSQQWKHQKTSASNKSSSKTPLNATGSTVFSTERKTTQNNLVNKTDTSRGLYQNGYKNGFKNGSLENGSGNDYYNRWRENQKEKVVSEQRPEQNPQQANSRPLSKLSNTDKEGAGTEHYKIEDVTDDPRYRDADENSWLTEPEQNAMVEYCRGRVVQPNAIVCKPAAVIRRPSTNDGTKNSSETKSVTLQNGITPPMNGTKSINGIGIFRNGTKSNTVNGFQTNKKTELTHQKAPPIVKNPTTTTNKQKTPDGITTTTILTFSNKNGVAGRAGSKSPSKPSVITPTSTGGTIFTKALKPSSGDKKLLASENTGTGTDQRRQSDETNQSPLSALLRKQSSATLGAVDKTKMAHIIDIEPGRPCTRMPQCNCFGFRPHPWRKVCVHCKCDRTDHEPGPNQALNVYERLGLKPSPEMAKLMARHGGGSNAIGSNNTSALSTDQQMGSAAWGYVWVPPGLSRTKVEDYMSQLPNHMIPRINSIGEKNRERNLMIQLPRQDLSIAYCKHLKTPQERKLYDDFVNARNELSLDIGWIQANIPKSMECRKCQGVIERLDIAVIAPKFSEGTCGWHAACFTCSTCDQLLVDLTYCIREDKVYCERHFAELHKPRCSACDELIFSGEYTKAMNKDWHSDHFCCWQCDSQLTGQRYILRDDHPYCIKCYEEIFANACDECNNKIGIDSKDLSYKDKHWHENCFLCNVCKVSLVDKPFGSKNERIFCSNCYDQAFATRCDGCNEIFKAGMKKMEYKGKQWHDKCFCCAACSAPIGTKSFIPKNEEVYCSTCYEEKFAIRCSKCKKVISSGGVTYKNEPWHRECFCCANCNTSLAGQRFTSKDEKPYCADCYGELFAKRCSACVKPITGIGGTKFISFEDRHWHNDCFLCGQCSTSLVGKGFITDGADILCAECAKARLMAANG